MSSRALRRNRQNHDPFFIALLAAVLFHAVLILGVGFGLPKPKPVEKSLDIVLVKTPSAKIPDQAEFLSPHNQMGSGEGKQKAIPRSAPDPRLGVGDDAREFAVDEKPVPLAKPKPKLAQERADKKLVADAGEEEREETEQPHLTQAALSQQIAELSAELNWSEDTQAKGPRTVEINAVSSHQYKAAAYEATWQQKVERIGNLNYPDEARRRRLSGSLTLAVGVKPDGSIYSIKVRQSSGEPVLDQAAQRIVRLAAPFAAFPEELKQQADVLVITRTWRFSMGNRMEARH